ncbi:MAG: hypothetical protein HY883_01635, partial [Deltaproteobacteria bacterium]|nr:hypothetical protein [Deltaproteobacteria bacterium]
MRKAVIPTIAFLFLAGLASGEEAARYPRELVKKEKKLEDVKKRLKEARGYVSKMSEKETDILGELEKVNMQLKENRDKLKKVGANLKDIESQVKKTDNRIGRLETERTSLDARLYARLRAMYKMRANSMVPVVFSYEAGA